MTKIGMLLHPERGVDAVIAGQSSVDLLIIRSTTAPRPRSVAREVESDQLSGSKSRPKRQPEAE